MNTVAEFIKNEIVKFKVSNALIALAVMSGLGVAMVAMGAQNTWAIWVIPSVVVVGGMKALDMLSAKKEAEAQEALVVSLADYRNGGTDTEAAA